jgi:roadblock/LC7 domain-containing protein
VVANIPPGGDTAFVVLDSEKRKGSFVRFQQLTATRCDMRVTQRDWLVAAVLLVLLSGISEITIAQELSTLPPSQSTDSQGQSPSRITHATAGTSLDPATFIRLYEDTKAGNRFSVYEPVQTISKKGLQLTADLESSIVIEPDAAKMAEDLSLNKLYITAKLASGNSSKDVVVNGYSEIGKDKSTMAAQTGAAFESAADVQAMVLNMAYTAGDIVRFVYQPSTQTISGTVDFTTWVSGHKDVDFSSSDAQQITNAIAAAVRDKKSNDEALTRLRNRLRLYQPEIQAISSFLLRSENLEIVEKLGVKIFWIDRDSMTRIAQQYKDNIQIAFDAKSTDEAQLNALQDLLERTKLVYHDFGDVRREIMTGVSSKYGGETHSDAEWEAKYQKALQEFAITQRTKAIGELKKLLATGSISLTENQAKDGDRLIVTVESVPSGSDSGGIPVVFEIAIKKYGAKIQWSPSLLFIRRLGVTDAEASPPSGSTAAPLNRINFAPSPGMTFGVAYFKRGQSSGDKFMRALGPGIGMNVTFMNFNDPSYDLTTGKFVNTTGTNVQIGAGVIGSLFDNKIQFTYGWNLNVEQRRQYFGVGFGFIEVGKELAKYIGSGSK